MSDPRPPRRLPLLALLGLATIAATGLPVSGRAATLDPHAVEFQRTEDIRWVRSADGGSERAELFGDPDQPGPYVMRIKWLPGHFSRPHQHARDRFFTVISGTWWVGTGVQGDTASTVPIPAGSYVLHKGGQVHYDGARDEETVIQVVGIGPVETRQVGGR